MTPIFEAAEDFAKRLDERDPLARFRERFALPTRHGEPVVYFNGNSLGLMPLAARELVAGELDDWAALAVDAHFSGKTPWFSYHEVLREPSARLVGADPVEIVAMNGLTVNLHLMMATFFRPRAGRDKILIEDGAFPSDTYAAQTQLAVHDFRLPQLDHQVSQVAECAGPRVEGADLTLNLDDRFFPVNAPIVLRQLSSVSHQ